MSPQPPRGLSRRIDMLALLASASILVSERDSPPPPLEVLAKGRAAFEDRLGNDEPTVACMMMGPGNEALFPFGVSNRRWLIELIGAQAPRLVRQSLHGRRAKTDWSLRLSDRRGPRPRSGALRRLLWEEGYSVAAKRLSRAQIGALDAAKPFALYTVYGPDDWLQVGTITSDGAYGTWDVYYDYPNPKAGFRPIAAEEAQALGQGAERWHGTGPLRYAHAATIKGISGAKVVEVP